MTRENRALTFLVGDLVYLRALDEADADGAYVSWLNDAAVCAGNSHHVLPYSRSSALDYIRRASTSGDLILAICLRSDDRHIGNVALTRVNQVYRCAEFSILLGDRDEWGKGYGFEAARLLLRHAFVAMNLERVACGTFATNTAMRKLALALGMAEEGVRRKAAWKDGIYLDIVEFGILRAEFSPGT